MDIRLLVSADANLAAALSRSRSSKSAFQRQVVPSSRASSCRSVRARSAAAAAPAAGGISGVRTAIDLFSLFISVSHDSFFLIVFLPFGGLENSLVGYEETDAIFGIRPYLDHDQYLPFQNRTESKHAVAETITPHFPFAVLLLLLFTMQRLLSNVPFVVRRLATQRFI
jgi:hypothetical protein